MFVLENEKEMERQSLYEKVRLVKVGVGKSCYILTHTPPPRP